MAFMGLGLFRMKLWIKRWLRSTVCVSEVVRRKVTGAVIKPFAVFCYRELDSKAKRKLIL